MLELPTSTDAPRDVRSTPEPSAERGLIWRIALLVWLLPALADVADVYLTRRMNGTPSLLWRPFAIVFPGWYVWAPLSPLIAWIGRRVPLRRPVRARAVAVHVASSLAVGVVHAMVLATARALFDPGSASLTWSAQLTMALQDWLPISIFLYWVVLGGARALENARRSRAEALRAAALEARLARSELAVLRAQLHPHFLFNALNTAVSLVRARDPDAGVRVLTHLSDLLRHLVHGVAQEVTLGEELALLESYLEIERARFRHRLSVDVHVPAELLDAVVPGLVLQPIVENAVRHGVGAREAPGRVRVEAGASRETLWLRVCDDGPGFPRPWRIESARGVGLRNTSERLARLYGDSAGLQLTNMAEGGAEVIVRLPLHRAPASAVAAG